MFMVIYQFQLVEPNCAGIQHLVLLSQCSERETFSFFNQRKIKLDVEQCVQNDSISIKAKENKPPLFVGCMLVHTGISIMLCKDGKVAR